jgi:hypothetical protein
MNARFSSLSVCLSSRCTLGERTNRSSIDCKSLHSIYGSPQRKAAECGLDNASGSAARLFKGAILAAPLGAPMRCARFGWQHRS